MAFALGVTLLHALCELPVVEPWTQFLPDGLRFLRAFVVAEVEIGKAQGFGQHPAVAVVYGTVHRNCGLAVAVVTVDQGFESVEGSECQDGGSEFGGMPLIDTPEAFTVRGAGELHIVDISTG
jgi:hypothetical protein